MWTVFLFECVRGSLFVRSEQCCGIGRFLTGTGSDFWKRPDPDPDLNKFSGKFRLKTFCPKNAVESIFMNQKVKQQTHQKSWYRVIY
jgi:hypothetical protein